MSSTRLTGTSSSALPARCSAGKSAPAGARSRWLKSHAALAARIRRAQSLQQVRAALKQYLDAREEILINADPSRLKAPEFYLATNCRRVLKNIISPRSEALAGFSAVEAVWRDLAGRANGCRLEEGFWQEWLSLFSGIEGRSGVYDGVEPPAFLKLQGREAGLERSRELNVLGARVRSCLKRYATGLENAVVRRRAANRRRVLGVLGGSDADWLSYRWHLSRIIRDSTTLGRIVTLAPAERAAIDHARASGIPFGITPYYASLFDRQAHRRHDHAVRAQVIPPLDYVEKVDRAGKEGIHCLDFMGESDTSPVDTVTRRYPQVAIFKPFNTCAQICVYCQRNWEIDDAMAAGALADRATIEKALAWFESQTAIEEVLITGGDPLMLPDRTLARILARFEAMPHVRRVRIGTRAPVVLPMRFNDGLIDVFRRFHSQKMQLAIVTHFEHCYEVTPEARAAVEAVRMLSMSVYNQQVFTIENSRKFETSALRIALKEIGVDPYYCFCAKGKEETEYYRVPVARILQERKEEARLTPGSVRTDEPIFNLPYLGKNYLRAGQDHHVISVMPDGSRMYEFLPWEKNLYPSPTYVHRDVPIYEYLRRLEARGENPDDYKNIWYYF